MLLYVTLSRASAFSGEPQQAAHTDSLQTSKAISANFSTHPRAWERYARRLRACVQQASRQLLEARQTSDLLSAQLDSMRMLPQECERQRDEALREAAQLNAEIQTLYHGKSATREITPSGGPQSGKAS